MNITTAAVTFVLVAAFVVAVLWLARTVLGDGAGRSAPQHGHAHWSGGSDDLGSPSLPDSPYRDQLA